MSPKKSEDLSTEIISENETPAEVEVDARFKGRQEAVKNAMRSYTEDTEGKNSNGEEAVEEIDEKLIRFLQDPKCMVIIKRIEPTRFQGIPCAEQVDRMECPVSFEDIRTRIEENHGGKKYRISIHPNTPTGEMKTLHAFPLEITGNPDPILYDEEQIDPRSRRPGGFRFPTSATENNEWAELGDPYAIPSQDPAVNMENHYRQTTKMLNDKLQMKRMKNAVEELESETRDDSSEEIRDLRKQIDERNLEQRLDSRFSSIESKMVSSGNGSDMTIALLQMMENSNQQQAQMRVEMMQQQTNMMQSFMEMNRKNTPSENFDSQLDRVVKMKDAMEGKSSNKIEGIMFDLLSDKLNGGSSDDADPVTVALKEGIEAIKPVLMELVTKNKPETESLSREEAKAAYEEAGRKAARQIAQNMQSQERQERLILQQKAQQKEFLIAQEEQRRMHEEKQSPKIQGDLKETPAPIPPLPKTPHEEEEFPAPPRPKEKGYDRNVAVNFVLDGVIDDIESGAWRSEEGSYVIGDFLDCLDSEILLGLTGISTGKQLEELIGPYADRRKLDLIINRGKENKGIEGWLEQVIVTVKNIVLRGEEESETITEKEELDEVPTVKLSVPTPTHVASPVAPSLAPPSPMDNPETTEGKRF